MKQILKKNPPYFSTPRDDGSAGRNDGAWWTTGFRRSIFMALLFPVFFFLASCAPYEKASVAVDNTRQDIAIQNRVNDAVAPPVVVKSGYYVDTNPVSLKKQPSWLAQPVTLQARGVPLNVLMDRLLRTSRSTVAYSETTQAQKRVNLNYQGTIKGALDALAAKTHYTYSIDGKTITWSAFESRTFNIAFMPGTSNYMVGGSEGGQDNNLMTDAPTVGGLHSQEFSNLHGELSIWNDLRRTLAQLKSPQGKVMVSESTTSVTVQDHPENMAQIANYIAQLNKSLSVQVGIKVQVLEVQLDSAFNLGINWNLVFRNMNPQLRIGGALADATNPESSLIGAGTDSGTASFQIGNAGSNALLQALGRQGKLRVVTKPQVVTMNNQIAAIRITKNTGYIKSISSANTINYVSTSITPGTVTDGFQLYLLPKVSGDKVFMQISSTISNLLSIQKESTSPDTTALNAPIPANASAAAAQQAQAATQQYSAIELPTVTEKSFNQRSVIQSGHTLVIAGFKRLFDQASNSTMANVIPGSKGAQSQNVETLVLITPVIMRTN